MLINKTPINKDRHVNIPDQVSVSPDTTTAGGPVQTIVQVSFREAVAVWLNIGVELLHAAARAGSTTAGDLHWLAYASDSK